MKLTVLIMTIAIMQCSANAYSQKINLNVTNTPLKKVLQSIKKQTGYVFFYDSKDISRKNITIDVKDASLDETLTQCFKKLALTYRIVNNTVFLKEDVLPAKGDVISNNVSEATVASFSITGQVTDDKNMPLQGVTVKLKGGKAIAVTDNAGKFKIDVPDNNSILVFSYIGFTTKETPVTPGNEMAVILVPDQSKLNEVVVVGYGTKRKAEITSSIASVNINQLSANASNNVTDALQGRVSGVSVESSSGAPGSGSSITIRGSSTLGVNSPLVVIDGMPFGSLDGLNPSDIQSIDVLKDAAAASIYGSRAAGGVVLVTTKLGKKNSAPKVQVNSVYSEQTITKRMPLLNGEQWTNLFNANGGAFPAYNGTNTNWQDQIFRSAPIYKANADVTGGAEHFVYSLSGSYLNQTGTVIKTNFYSGNFRAKSLYEKGRVKIGETFIYNKDGGRSLPPGYDQSHSIIRSALIMPPTVPVYDPTNPLGGWGRVISGMKNLSNPVANLNATNDNYNNSLVTADVFGEIRLVDQLKYKINVGLSENRGFGDNYINAYNDGNGILNLPTLSQNTSFSNSVLIEHTLNYDKKIGLHSISLLAGFTSQKDSATYFYASGNNIPIGIYALSAAASGQSIGGGASATKRESLIGRVSYSYDSRYFMSAAIRRDGSSIFASGYQYGVFPSISAGWNISNEKFYSNSSISRVMNSLKFRGSIGLLGNDQIPNYSTVNSITNNANFLTNGGMILGSYPSGTASPANLRWEQTKTTDAGIDAEFFDSKLSLVFDWYNKTSSGVLLAVPIPSSAGISGTPVVNAGVVNNKGIELAVEYSDKAGAFTYKVGWNMTTIRNRMTAITIGSGNQQFGNLERAMVGYPLGSFFLVKTAGIFKTQADINAYKGPGGQLIQPNAQPGDIRFVDYNKDGQIDNNDQQYAGSPIPTFETGLTGSLAWKNFDANLLVQGVFGNKIYNESRIWMEQMTAYTNLSTSVLNAWTPQNSNSNFPRFILADPNLNARVNSDRWLENGSYVRIKRFEIGYTIADSLAKRLNVAKVRVYLSGENLFTFSKYKGYNPDLGNGGGPLSRGYDIGTYPLQRIISVGLNVSF